MAPLWAAAGVWVAWAVSWGLAAAWSKPTAERPGLGAELPYRAATAVGALLLFGGARFRWIDRLWLTPPALGWVLVGLTAAGFAFCWWARLYLGGNWSSSVTRKEGHKIVDTGPYALVRHPIYTGLILAAAAVAVLAGTAASLAGAAVLAFGCWIKARLEERFLRRSLGEAAYDAYARRTAMLIPFLRV
ncbi:MAG TPA: isoprenylcysteine carboxylmethyltransferase family protein [Caulobacteraceae bacterium]|nr:isoprenylcysteine carboxylmethyltransferase family protein [Caulobacteraceae bacterium]